MVEKVLVYLDDYLPQVSDQVRVLSPSSGINRPQYKMVEHSAHPKVFN